MALNLYKAVVQLPPKSGLPADFVDNDFYFRGTSTAFTAPLDAASISDRLVTFYNIIPTGQTKQISDYIGNQVSRVANSAKIVVYAQPIADIGDPWGSPVTTTSWTIGNADASTALPAEVAAVLSFHGVLTDIPETQTNPSPPPAIIRPAARRRGRVYVGPINILAGGEAVDTFDLQLTAVFRGVLTAAAKDLADANGTNDLNWIVYSKTALETHEVVGGWVDSAFDTQRRRGSEASARTLWSA